MIDFGVGMCCVGMWDFDMDDLVDSCCYCGCGFVGGDGMLNVWEYV